MNNEILEKLIKNGAIKSYKLEALDEDGNPGVSKFRNTERLTLEFLNGDKLVVGTFCSGCLENTVFLLGEDQ